MTNDARPTNPPSTTPADASAEERASALAERCRALHQIEHALRVRLLNEDEMRALEGVLPPSLLRVVQRVSASAAPPGEVLPPLEADDQMWSPPSRAEVAYAERQAALLGRDLEAARADLAEAVGRLERAHKKIAPGVTLGSFDADLEDFLQREDRLRTTLRRIVNEHPEHPVVEMAREALK